MFTIIGAAIGLLIGVITIVTNATVFASVSIYSLFVSFLFIMFSFISFGGFIGLVIDTIVEKIR